MTILINKFDPKTFRQQFPYLQRKDAVVYLDSAATALKPQTLIQSTMDFYCSAGSVHRSQYDAKQTACFEQARQLVCELIHAENKRAIIWTSGTTQAINTVAYGLEEYFQPGDEIIISQADHHANFVTWHEISKKNNLKIHVLHLQDNWLINPAELQEKLNAKTKLVALNWVSNVTGSAQSINDLVQIIRQKSKALILVDAAQAIGHRIINLQKMDIDFIAFSAHKLYGPTGLGVLSGKLSSLQQLKPVFYGGKMVDRVNAQDISFSDLPYRLEAGTPNIAAVIGFHAVLAWLQQWDLNQMEQYVCKLAEHTRNRLSKYLNCRLFNSPQPSGIISFIFEDIECSDLATLFAEQNIALRVGEHCAQPYLARLGQTKTLRLSFAPYNNEQDISIFFQALEKNLILLRE